MFDVFFYEAFEEERAQLESCMPESIKAGYTEKTIQEADHSEPPAGIISIRTQSAIPHRWSTGLFGILSRSAGYDHLLAYRKESNYAGPCGYLPEYCVRAVAEHAMMQALALLRKLPRQMEQFNRFHRDGITGREMTQKTLVVVGVGRIGHEIARIGTALGMKVLGVDIVKKHNDVSYEDIDDALAEADTLVCAMNLTDENRGYFTAERFAKLKHGAVFVNIARGELAPTGVLLEARKAGVLAGIGLDVFENENELAVALREGRNPSGPEIHALLELKELSNVLLTPHNAFNTEEAVERKAQQSVEQLKYFIENGAFLWSVPV